MENQNFTIPVRVEHNAVAVLTTEQLAKFYECDANNIKKNFNANKDRFVDGKHYYVVSGDELNKLRVTAGDMQISSMTRTLYLWTERGAARHAKILSNDKAWEVFEFLEDNYFSPKEINHSTPNAQPPVTEITVATPVDPNPPKIYELIEYAGKSAEAIEKYYGVKHGIALAKATEIVEDIYHIDFTKLKALIPPADHEIGFLTPTQIGKRIGESPQFVNKKLIELELQEINADGDGYRLTENGKNLAEALPYTRNGHSGYQIKWQETVVDMIRATLA